MSLPCCPRVDRVMAAEVNLQSSCHGGSGEAVAGEWALSRPPLVDPFRFAGQLLYRP